MNRVVLPSGVGYFNLDIFLTFNDFIIDLVGLLNETDMQTAPVKPEDFYHLIYFKEGKTEVEFENKKFEIQPGTFLYYGSSTFHKEFVKQKGLVKYHIIFYLIPKKKKRLEKHLFKFSDESNEIRSQLENCPDFLIIKDNNESTSELFEKLIKEIESERFGYLYSATSLLTEIFVSFCRSQVSSSKSNRLTHETASSLLLSAQISANLAVNYKDVTLKKLANEFFMSERQIQRHINKLHNTSFSKKVNEHRISAAKDLLITSDLSVNEISEEVGFKYTSYFVNVFKELEGITPLQYRKSYPELV